MHTKQHPRTTLAIHTDKGTLETSVKFSNFTDGDTHCLIEDTTHIKGNQVIIKHYLYPNQNEQIVRLLLLLNTLVSLGAESVSTFIPYLPYARQDKAHNPGESISSSILCHLLKVSGCDNLHTIDCHFMKGKRSAVVEGLNIHNVLVQDSLIKQLEALTKEPYKVIGPDEGSSYLSSGQTMKKARKDEYAQTEDGSIHRSIATLNDDHLSITSNTVVIADDMISTGGTMVRALENLRDRGIPNLYAITTHGLFLNNSFEKIQGVTKGIIYSDTIAHEDSTPVVDRVFADILQNYSSLN